MSELARPTGKKSWKFVWICISFFVGSALLDVSSVWLTRRNINSAQLEADEGEYYHLAGEMEAGKYSMNPRRVVGFTAILAALRMVFNDNLFSLQIAVTLIFSMVAPLMFLLVHRELRGMRCTAFTAAI